MQELRVDFPVLFEDLGVIARRCGVFDLPTSLVIENGILMAKYSAYSEKAKKTRKDDWESYSLLPDKQNG